MDSKALRATILEAAKRQLGKPYKFGAEVNLDDPDPKEWDCSELVEWSYHQAGLHIPDGSYNQFQYCASTDDPHPGDLGFFRETREKNLAGRKIGEIYHVGIMVDNTRVIEARGRPMGTVLYRPVIAWREYVNFAGWRVHPNLM